jgi:putative ATP-binding cassette transporter
MSEPVIPINRHTWGCFVRSVRSFLGSEARGRAWGFFGLLLFLLFAINGLNVVNSYVARNFMTAIAGRDFAGFVRLAMLYLGVFAGSTAVAVFQTFSEQRLGLLWRAWLTGRLIGSYLAGRSYYWLKQRGLVDNPDERIAEDVKIYTATALSFVLVFVNGTLTVVAFAGVLWTISRLLFVVAISYAVLGSLLTIRFGRPLIRLNYRQLEREANFRRALIQVQEYADPTALMRWERPLATRLLRRLDDLVANFGRIIAVSRNLGFFTVGYNYLIQIIPLLIVAPLYIRGEVEFGVVTQSAMAFGCSGRFRWSSTSSSRSPRSPPSWCVWTLSAWKSKRTHRPEPLPSRLAKTLTVSPMTVSRSRNRTALTRSFGNFRYPFLTARES